MHEGCELEFCTRLNSILTASLQFTLRHRFPRVPSWSSFTLSETTVIKSKLVRMTPLLGIEGACLRSGTIYSVRSIHSILSPAFKNV